VTPAARPRAIRNSPPSADGADPHAYATYLNTRPRQWEEDAIRAIINISSKETPIHIAHLADAQRFGCVASVLPLLASNPPLRAAFR